jgi:hypothetical protein
MELRKRRLTRFRNDSSHPDFSLLLDSNKQRLFTEKKTRVKDLSFPADFKTLYRWLYPNSVKSSDCGNSSDSIEQKTETTASLKSDISSSLMLPTEFDDCAEKVLDQIFMSGNSQDQLSDEENAIAVNLELSLSEQQSKIDDASTVCLKRLARM